MTVKTPVKPIPQGFHTVTPFIMVSHADKVLEFMKHALGAKEITRLNDKKGRLWHVQVKVGDSMLMLADTMGDHPSMPCTLYIYSNDADGLYKRAIDAGAESIVQPVDQFYGDRAGGVKDPAGNMWWFAKHIEDVPEEELAKRAYEVEAA